MVGWVGSETLIRRAQPQGQPKLGSVKVPYTSSVVRANERPGTCTAEWPLGQAFEQGTGLPQMGRFAGSVSSRSCGLGTLLAMSLVFRTSNSPASMAREVRVPSAETPIEWTKRLKL